MFHKVHFVENWGRGISLILSKEPTAEFKEVGTHFITIFKRKNVPVNVPVNRLEKIKEIIQKNNKITILEIASELNVNEKTIKRDIDKLKKESILKRVGSDKKGYWEIKQS